MLVEGLDEQQKAQAHVLLDSKASDDGERPLSAR